jgi:hypothetical protein
MAAVDAEFSRLITIAASPPDCRQRLSVREMFPRAFAGANSANRDSLRHKIMVAGTSAFIWTVGHTVATASWKSRKSSTIRRVSPSEALESVSNDPIFA